MSDTTWKIAYTEASKQDLRDIRSYISEELLSPETAAGQVGRIIRQIRSLDEMPMKYRRYEEEPWYSEGVRIPPVDNYLVFYLPKETLKTVYIVRIMYGGRDVPKHLGDIDINMTK